MSVAEDILGAIGTMIGTVTDAGMIHTRLRWAESMDTYLDEFKFTPGGGATQIRGWMVTLSEASPMVGTFGDFDRFGSIQRTYHTTIRFVMSLKDSASTESDFWTFLEAVGNVLDTSKTLGLEADGVQVLGCGPYAVNLVQQRAYGPVLCHYAEIAFPVETLITPVYV